MHLAAPGALLLSVLIWGLSPVATRYLVLRLDPLSLLVLRAIVSSLIFLPFLLRARPGAWRRADLARAGISGLLGVIGAYAPATYGVKWVPAGVAGVVFATEPVWVILLSLLVLRERLSGRVVAGVLLSGAGIALLMGRSGGLGEVDLQLLGGVGLLLLSAFMWGAYLVAMRPLTQRHGALTTAAVSTILGTLPLAALADRSLLRVAAGFDIGAWSLLLLLAAGSTVVATVLWNYGMVRMPATQAGLFLYLVPLSSVLGGNWLLQEPLEARTLVAGALIIAGVAVAQSRPAGQPAPAAGPPGSAPAPPARTR